MFVNGVPQQAGVDFDQVGRALVFRESAGGGGQARLLALGEPLLRRCRHVSPERHGGRRVRGGRQADRAQSPAHAACLSGLVASRPWPASSSHTRGGPCCPTGLPSLLFLIVLTALSAYVRTRELDGGFWIDEGLSVGIAHHHWSSIPGFCPRMDLHRATTCCSVCGSGSSATESARRTHSRCCSGWRAFRSGTQPARAVFDRKTGLICATLAAFDPFLTYYAQETRMYEVEALLSIVVAYAYVQGVLRGRTPWTVALVPALAAMIYVPQLGALPLCRAGCRDPALRATADQAVRARRRRRGCALPAVGADRCSRRCGTPARRGRRLQAFAIWCSRRAPWSTETRCWWRSCSSAAAACSRSPVAADDDEHTIVLRACDGDRR